MHTPLAFDARRLRPWLRLGALFLGVALATTQRADAQSAWACNTMVRPQTPPALRLFGGSTYHLQAAVSEDSTPVEALDGLSDLKIPDHLGSLAADGLRLLQTRAGSYAPAENGNYTVAGGAFIEAWWKDIHDGLIAAGTHYDPGLKYALNAGFCVTNRGEFVLRGGIQRDLRYRAKSLGELLRNRALGRGPAADRTYVGVTVWSTLLPGDAFPVQRYSVYYPQQATSSSYNQTQWRKAQDAALALYKTRAPAAAMLHSAYEFLLHGSVRESETTVRECTRNFWGRRVCKDRKAWRYDRQLIGTTRRIQWTDFRVLDEDTTQSSGGVMTDLTTVWQSDPLTTTDSRVRDLMRRSMQTLCGSTTSCGSVSVTRPWAEGQHAFGGADSTYADNACNNMPELQGIRCRSDANPFVPPATASDSALKDVVSRTSAYEVQETDAQKAQKKSGRRSSVQIDSQLEEVCHALAERDSVRVVNGPQFPGDPAPAYTSAMVRKYVDDCLTRKDSVVTSDSTSQASGAPRSAPVRGSGPPSGAPRATQGATTPTGPKRCYEFNNTMYCVPVRTARPPS